MSSVKSALFALPDGAKLAYEIHGSEHLEKGKLPLIFICGLGCNKMDWDRILPLIVYKRPALVFDYRGMGQSTESTSERTDKITIEVMATDLVALIKDLGWTDVDMLGFSMGGVVLQQILLLPVHPTQPTTLPFRVHHALLTGTFASTIKNPWQPPPIAIEPPGPGQVLTKEQKLALVRPLTEASLGASFVNNPVNKERLELWLERATFGRPFHTIMKQRRALRSFNFSQELRLIDPTTKIFVIHGTEDIIVPFSHAEEIMCCCPHAKFAQLGSGRGKIPSYVFGHIWYEYFDPQVWIGVLETFLDDDPLGVKL